MSAKNPPGRGVLQGGWDGEAVAQTPSLVETADPPRRMEKHHSHGLPPEVPRAPFSSPPLWGFVCGGVSTPYMHAES